MKTLLPLLLLSVATGLAVGAPPLHTAPAALDLSGAWRFALDRADVGLPEAWFERRLPEAIQLPGVLQAQGYGDEISTNTPWVLSLYDKNWFLREDYKPYAGPASD